VCGRTLQLGANSKKHEASACHRNSPQKQHGCYSCAEEASTLKAHDAA